MRGLQQEYPDLKLEILLSDIRRKQKGTQIHATEKHLTLIKKTDEAFEELLQYFSNQNEKTIILMFHHQPSDYICNPILRMLGLMRMPGTVPWKSFQRYIVPFVHVGQPRYGGGGGRCHQRQLFKYAADGKGRIQRLGIRNT